MLPAVNAIFEFLAEGDKTPSISIVGMSATLPNLDLLAQWLSADLYFTEYRPVPLTEMIKMGNAIYDGNMNKVKDIDSKSVIPGDDEHVIALCMDTLSEGNSVLIFCPTKNWCEKLSETIAKHFALCQEKERSNQPGASDFKTASQLISPNAGEVAQQLRNTQVGLDSSLAKSLPYGVAFHHAGLTFDERDIVESAFRRGVLRVLVATSTLSSGTFCTLSPGKTRTQCCRHKARTRLSP